MKIESVNEILIVAAEDSSCLYAQRLLEMWQDTDKSVKAFGIGNQSMKELGFECIARSENLSVVGLSEVIKHWGEISSAFKTLVKEAEIRKPKFALLLDYPDFNLRLAKKLKKMGIKVIYYISPQLWAWRKSRIKIVQRYIDKMLVLFPFEENFYKENNVDVSFVGHPLLDEMDESLLDTKKQNSLRERYGIQPDEITLGLMPGSRRSELSHHIQVQLEAAKLLKLKYSKLRICLLTAPSFPKAFLQQTLSDLGFDQEILVMKDEPLKMLASMDYVLTASGTATLYVGLMQKPMLVMYRMNRISSWVAKTFVGLKTFGLVNIILGESVAPEFFQEKATPNILSENLQRFIEDKVYRENYLTKMSKIQSKLGSGGANKKVFSILNEYLNE